MTLATLPIEAATAVTFPRPSLVQEGRERAYRLGTQALRLDELLAVTLGSETAAAAVLAASTKGPRPVALAALA